MVFAFAGDSTTTSVDVPGSGGGPSSTGTVGLRDFALEVAFFFVALRAAFLTVGMVRLVNRLVVPGRAAVFQTRSLEHSSKVLDSDAPIHLEERPLDDVLELDRVYSPRPAERQ